ncbi:MAG: ABC transporter ATP-binding protein, partial [Chitinivibrionales bacterium]|nr:ABC transporter ATP-binding protein [Chitinivibrionales bacterium]
VTFRLRKGRVYAVQDVSFTLDDREIVGVVGESGCGKSTLCLALLKLIPPETGALAAGQMLFDGTDLQTVSAPALRALRGNTMSMVFQDPAAALNPYLRVLDQVAEPLRVHKAMPLKQARIEALKLLAEAGIKNPGYYSRFYPHEFSGGMRQRAMIAMALATRPKLLIADEPTTGLDVTIQAQIIALLKDLQARYGMSVIFITHDLGVVAGLCKRVMVMYAGRIVESGTTENIFYATGHPYTRALIKALPIAHEPGKTLTVIGGAPPDLNAAAAGCPFAPRCDFAATECGLNKAELTELAPGHASACRRMTLGEITL